MAAEQALSGAKGIGALPPSLPVGKTPVEETRNDVHYIYPNVRILAWSP